jgi:prepilin-type processing-associated H-X9-DG protein
VIVGVLAILALTVLPALARSQPHARAAQCRHNLKQLAVAWQMYPEDYSGRIVANFGSGYIPGPNGSAGWASGWLDWSISSDNTNTLLLTDARYAALAPYIQGAVNLFKCPADDYLSLPQRARGWSHRVRSYSVNAYIGENAPLGHPGGPSDFSMYRQTKTVSEFRFPSPPEVAVFIDEHPDTINDPGFFSPGQSNWPDLPATYHNGAAAISFADGHTEAHQWKGSLTTGQATRVSYLSFNNYSAPAGDADISWMSYHTPRVSTNSY